MDLHLRQRPKTLSGMFGHKAVINSLSSFKELPHTFLFHGPSGTGKTTLSRILATLIKCEEDIVEIDAATNTGVDDVRELLKTLPYQGFSSGRKLIILDECHMLSKSAWNALLKVLEEPPEHVYFSLCTTELNKVPKTICTRAHMYELKPLANKEIEDLLWYVCDEEGFSDSFIYTDEDIFNKLVEASGGSPRQALVYVSACLALKEEAEVLSVLQSASDHIQEVIDFSRAIVKGPVPYELAKKFIKAIKTNKVNPESARIQIMGYVAACLLNARAKRDFFRLAGLLDAFASPIYNTVTGYQDLILQVCNTVED